MFEQEETKEEFNELIEAVTEAIKGSEKVREILYRLYREKVISPKALLALFLKMKVSFFEDNIYDETVPDKQCIGDVEVSPCAKSIDGKPVTPEEEAFEKYYSERFDEEKWLKKLGLRFEN